jgi:lysosomal Pro-X carboxypeptidase
LFAEHRYYGESLPFGNNSFVNPNISYLTSEQALGDYAYLIRYIKSSIKDANDSAVIAFGGSYGGMLSAWFRMKYPNIVDGALAASAPVRQFVVDCDSFSLVTTNTFRKANRQCPEIISSSWSLLDKYSETEQGLQILTDVFHLCEPLTDVQMLKDWLVDLYGSAAMSDYPYAADFLSHLPAWPVRVIKHFANKLIKYKCIKNSNNRSCVRI